MSDIPGSTLHGVSGQQYDNGVGDANSNGGAMLPSQLPPINTDQTQGSLASDSILSPMSPGGTIRRSAPEPNKRALYVGGLDQRVTEDVLRQIFETTGRVQNVKVIPDKNFQSKGYNYGFVEYEEMASAERAMQTLNGRSIHQNEIRVNWAYQSNNSTSKEDTTNHFHIFVGDLSNEVNDEILLQAFSAFGSVSEARVMWDMKTGRSRGYGFVAFRDKGEAEKGLSAMNGEWLGSRAIRCNWANQKGQPSIAGGVGVGQALTPTGLATSAAHFAQLQPQHQPWSPPVPPTALSYNTIVSQTAHWQTTVYVGNITPYTTQNDIVPFFQVFGYVVEVRLQSDRGFAFVKMDTHEHAAMAICQINGYNVHGRNLKLSWGKDRAPPGSVGAVDSPVAVQGATPAVPQTMLPQSPNGYFPTYHNPNGPSLIALQQAQAAGTVIARPTAQNMTAQTMAAQTMAAQTMAAQPTFAQSPPAFAQQYNNGGFGRGQQGPPAAHYPGVPTHYQGAASAQYQSMAAAQYQGAALGQYHGAASQYQGAHNGNNGAYGGNFTANAYQG